jgi:hypothetical protein
MFGTLGVLLLISLIGFVATSLVTLASTTQSIAALHGETLTVRETIRRAFSRLFALIGVYLAMAGATILAFVAVMFVVILLVLLLGLLAAGIGELFVDPSIGGPDSLPFAIGFVLLIICLYALAIVLFMAPIVYLYSRWRAVVPAMIAEDLGPLSALGRSWQLSQGSVWRSIFFTILLFVVSTMVVGIPVSILQSAGSIIGLLNTSLGGLLYAASIGLSFIVSVVWQPFAAVASVIFYYDLRVRRESYDLELRVSQLESQVAGASAQP